MSERPALLVSALSVDITPQQSCPLAGFAARPSPFRGVADRLEASVAVIRDGSSQVVLVAVDALYVGALRAMVLERVKAKLGRAELFMAASHTHFAPATDPALPGLGDVDPVYLDMAADITARGIDACLRATPVPAELAWATRPTRQAINRRRMNWRLRRRPVPRLERAMELAPNRRGPTDGLLRALVARSKEDAKVLAVLWNFACHPVAFPRRDMVSAEFPGVVRAALRASFGAELPVLFLQGFAGNQRPNIVESSWFHAALGLERFNRPDEAKWQAWAGELAAEVGSLVAQARDLVDGSLSTGRVALSLNGVVESAARERSVSFHRVAFGRDVAIVGISAEPIAEWAPLLTQRVGAKLVMPVGYIDEVYGYWPTNQVIGEGGYEAGQFFPSFSLTGRFASDVEAPFLQGLERVLSDQEKQG